jgi:bis(5'-nucleosyl)-tetraphosphatase (symmetrical)
MTTYVVGDIQGCFEPFKCLLNQVGFNEDSDTLWAVGDVVNRGPDNLATLRWFYERRDNVVLTLGNHDLHLLAVSAGARRQSKSDNFDDILDAPDRDELIEWLHFRPLVHNEHGVTMVHAGIPPMWTVQNALDRAWEVETILQSARCKEFFTAMYGNEPCIWQDDLSGLTRLRVITNYLTRMRYCTRKGKLDLINKGATPDQDVLIGKKVAPWFSHPERLTKNDTIIFGHWASLEGLTDSEKTIGLDTGCVWGNQLTFYDLDNRRFHACRCP